MRGEDGNVLGAFAQRRDGERNHVQAVEKILAESVAGDFFFKFFVGGRDHAHVHAHGLIRADRFDALFFERAQDFRLRLQAHVADFIEEKSAAVGA